jgi:hypothetical protein
MAEPQIVTTLRSKRDELERIISSYETATIAARRDLMHVNATLELFERDATGLTVGCDLSSSMRPAPNVFTPR